MINVLHMIEIQLKERVKVFDFGVYSTMADSGRHFLIKDIVILYKVLSIFVVKSQLNWQCHTYMYNSCTDNFH